MKQHTPWFISCLRGLSVFLISLSMLASIGVIGFAMQFLVELGFIGPVIGTNSPFYISAVTTLSGVVTFVMTPLGFFSMITSKKTMMLSYCVIMIFVIAMCFYSAMIAHSLKAEIEAGDMEQWMATSLREEYGHPYGESVDKAWDRMQQDMNCCGVRKPNGSEWLTTMWYKSLSSHPRARVPLSCCATCDDIHVSYCTFVSAQLQASDLDNVTFFNSTAGQKIIEDQRICLKASEFCSSADSAVANEGVCTGQAVPPRGLPRVIFQHDQACYPILSQKLISSMEAFTFVDSLFAFIILLCCLSWTVLSLLSHYSYHSVTN